MIAPPPAHVPPKSNRLLRLPPGAHFCSLATTDSRTAMRLFTCHRAPRGHICVGPRRTGGALSAWRCRTAANATHEPAPASRARLGLARSPAGVLSTGVVTLLSRLWPTL